MAKHIINTEQDLITIKEDVNINVQVGDIIVHKNHQFSEMYGLVKKYLNNAIIFPASPGTPVYERNGYNTSAITGYDTTGQ